MKFIVRKAFINKKNNQLSITVPRKSFDNKLKYNKNLFFEIKVFHKKSEGEN